jgi:hypothetical protein
VRERAGQRIDKAVSFVALANPQREMGTACSRRLLSQPKGNNLYILRLKFSCRCRAESLRRVPSLATLCLQSLASNPSSLTASHVARLSNDLAQILFEALICYGTLDFGLLGIFEGVQFWRLPLKGYPGVCTGWVAALDSQHLTAVDLSHTQVRYNLWFEVHGG